MASNRTTNINKYLINSIMKHNYKAKKEYVPHLTFRSETDPQNVSRCWVSVNGKECTYPIILTVATVQTAIAFQLTIALQNFINQLNTAEANGYFSSNGLGYLRVKTDEWSYTMFIDGTKQERNQKMRESFVKGQVKYAIECLVKDISIWITNKHK